MMKSKTLRAFGASLICAALLIGCATTPAVPPTLAQGQKTGEWITWGGDAGFMRYGALDQINADNVGQLEVAWRWKSQPLGARPDSNYKATPLMIDGVLYTPTGVAQAAAIDPETGKTLWLYTAPKTSAQGRGPSISSRGLAYWTDGARKRLFHNTLDGRLLSIDAVTGKADPAFGAGGAVDLRQNLTDRPIASLGSSSPPTVVGDVVVAQVVGEITAPRREATPGHIRGYDVRTGKLLWTFHTIPQAGEFGNETWENESWRYTGNAGVWTMMSADLERGLIYLPVESGSHDFYGGHRLGDGLFGESLVCLDARTGKRVWHYQIVHHGVWDYDVPAAPILHDIKMGGRTIKAVTLLTKQGMTFVFDRYTGKPVWPIEERAVPTEGAAPGERLSPTQPFPTKPAPFSSLGYHENELIDFTPQLRAEALKIAERYVRGPMYTPTTVVREGGTQGSWVYPGYGGGANWNGGAFDPGTGLLFTPTRNAPMVAALTPADPTKTNWAFNRAPSEGIAGPQGLPILRPPWSLVTATDMNRGDHIWRRPLGGAPDEIRNHPALKGLKLDFDDMGHPGVRPGPLATKSLLFLAEAGNLSGDPGTNKFRAYDKKTGKVVAVIDLPSKASGAPMTYMHKGRQYIVIAVATQQHPAELVALALPGARQASATQETPAATPAAPGPAIAATPAQLAAGKAIYARACAGCHGPQGKVSAGGLAPSIAGMADMAAIKQIVTNGGAVMPAMRASLSDQEIDEVSRFVAVELKP